MAWNQFPMNQNYNFPQGNTQMPMQAQPVMQNTFMPIVVRDKSEAESYPMAASQTAQTAQLQQYGNQLAQNVVTTCCPKPVPAYVVPNPGCGCNGGYVG